MNKDMMKSLRQAMLSTAAAALVSIGFTACSEDTFVTQNTTAPVDGSYQVCIPASKSGAGTRAIAYNSETGGYDATFEMTDKIIVYNVTQKAESSKLTEGGWTQLTTLSPDANGKSANLIGELGFSRWDDETGTRVAITPAKGDELMLLYNNINYGNWEFGYSNWSGEIIPDYAIAKVTIESINDGVIKTSAASFENPQSAYRINFTGIGSGVKIKKVTIESEQRKLVNYYDPLNIEWPNYFGSVNYSYEGEGTDQQELTFMLRFANRPDYETSESGDVITFRAVGSDGHYYVGTKTVENELVEGLYYLADVAMADAGLAMTLTNDATEEKTIVDSWVQIFSSEAPYTLENTGFGQDFEWYGGQNSLTFKNIYLNTQAEGFRLFSGDDDDTKNHNLVLEGENTLYCYDDYQGIKVWDNCSLYISAKSEGGKLNITKGRLYLSNATTTIKSGEITVNGEVAFSNNSILKVEGGVLSTKRFDSWGGENSCIISKGAKLRIANDGYIPEGLIKAAEGYVLTVSQEGEYLVYTAIEDDGSGLAKSIVVSPATATLFYSSSNRQGIDLRAYVYPETATDKSVTWTTSNPDVVQVDEYGWAYSTGVGTATVTATTNDGSNLSAKCEITVKPLGGIWYEYENREVNVTPDSKPFIHPLVQEGNITSITYTSSDTSIATVNASTGEVTIAAGATVGQSVTITATATVEEDGKYIYPEWRREASYTVKLVPSTGQGVHEGYTPASW